MQSSNPALGQGFLERIEEAQGRTATRRGAVVKSGILLALCFAAAAVIWELILDAGLEVSALAFFAMTFGAGFIVALLTIFVPRFSPVTGPLYALLQGAGVGGITFLLEKSFPGIAANAILLTAAVTVVMLIAYAKGWLQATPKFTAGVVLATAAVAVIYLISLLSHLIFNNPLPFIHEGGWGGIAFSLVVVGIASLNLILDFDLIDSIQRRGAPAYFEWYCGFALLITLIWLYIEILHLLSKKNR